MITPSFSPTATERVLPKLALDFTTASLDPRVTFTRSGNTATVTNSSGYIQTVNADIPRFDYDPTTLACKGLLVEESRTNLILQSQTFETTWAAGSATVGSNITNGPDGQQTADTLIPNNGAAVSYTDFGANVNQTVTKAASAITYTFTVFAKANDFDGIRLYVRDHLNNANGVIATYSLTDGSVVSAAAATGTFTNASSLAGVNYKNGWYRFSMSFTSGTETTLRFVLFPANSTATTGNGSKNIYVWGAQLEVGAFATSYIPTTTTALTRNADVATMTGTNFSDWYNIGAGSWYIQTNAQNADTVLTAGAFTLTANATALKKYANSYATDQSATSLVLGRGTAAKVSYYKQALLAAELAALVN